MLIRKLFPVLSSISAFDSTLQNILKAFFFSLLGFYPSNLVTFCSLFIILYKVHIFQTSVPRTLPFTPQIFTSAISCTAATYKLTLRKYDSFHLQKAYAASQGATLILHMCETEVKQRAARCFSWALHSANCTPPIFSRRLMIPAFFNTCKYPTPELGWYPSLGESACLCFSVSNTFFPLISFRISSLSSSAFLM